MAWGWRLGAATVTDRLEKFGKVEGENAEVGGGNVRRIEKAYIGFLAGLMWTEEDIPVMELASVFRLTSI